MSDENAFVFRFAKQIEVLSLIKFMFHRSYVLSHVLLILFFYSTYHVISCSNNRDWSKITFRNHSFHFLSYNNSIKRVVLRLMQRAQFSFKLQWRNILVLLKVNVAYCIFSYFSRNGEFSVRRLHREWICPLYSKDRIHRIVY